MISAVKKADQARVDMEKQVVTMFAVCIEQGGQDVQDVHGFLVILFCLTVCSDFNICYTFTVPQFTRSRFHNSLSPHVLYDLRSTLNKLGCFRKLKHEYCHSLIFTSSNTLLRWFQVRLRTSCVLR